MEAQEISQTDILETSNKINIINSEKKASKRPTEMLNYVEKRT